MSLNDNRKLDSQWMSALTQRTSRSLPMTGSKGPSGPPSRRLLLVTTGNATAARGTAKVTLFATGGTSMTDNKIYQRGQQAGTINAVVLKAVLKTRTTLMAVPYRSKKDPRIFLHLRRVSC